MAEVELIGVGKRFGSTQVIRNVDLLIQDNEFVVMVGPSGCGKSTILRMIAGLETTTSGEIHIGGRDVTHVSPKDRNVAMVFQNYALYPHMTVRENMGFSLKMTKHSRDEIAAKVKETAEILELTPYLDRKPSELSGGQRQRVAMGRAMVRKPDVFLFDEPLSNLDAKLRTQMRRELRTMHMQLKTTTIYVTHDQVEAMTLADRIVILKDGDVQQVGTPVEVYEEPVNMFVARFIGNPPMNIMDATFLLKDGKPCVQTGETCFQLPEEKAGPFAEGRPIKAGVRPDAIKVGDAAARLPEEWHCTGKVVLSEILGGHSLLELTVDDNSLIAQVEGRILAQAGDDIPMALEMDRMRLFDPETTEALA